MTSWPVPPAGPVNPDRLLALSSMGPRLRSVMLLEEVKEPAVSIVMLPALVSAPSTTFPAEGLTVIDPVPLVVIGVRKPTGPAPVNATLPVVATAPAVLKSAMAFVAAFDVLPVIVMPPVPAE